MASGTDSSGLLNITSNTTMVCPSPQGMVARILPPVLIIEMIVGLPGNCVALCIFLLRLKDWRPSTLLLVNLLLADFFLLVSVPFRIDNILRQEDWVFGPVWCRVNLFMLAVNRSSSIAFMTAVAVDRYMKVVHPHHRVNRMTKTQVAQLSGLIWAVVLALRLPLLSVSLLAEKDGVQQCRSFGPDIEEPVLKLHAAVYLAEFFLPLLLLSFCTARIFCVLCRRGLDKEKKVRRALRTVAIIVVVFAVCFAPGVAIGLVGVYLKVVRPTDCDAKGTVSQLFRLSIGFTYMNSALDPIIYCFSSSMFSDVLKGLVNRVGGRELFRRRGTSTNMDNEIKNDKAQSQIMINKLCPQESNDDTIGG